MDWFYDTMDTVVPHLWKLNSTFLELWDPLRAKYAWTLPDNFHAQFEPENKIIVDAEFAGSTFPITHKYKGATDKGRALGANITHSKL